MSNVVPALGSLSTDTPAALLHDAVDGRQAEPGALAFGLGREERLEQVCLDLGREPGPRVADRKPDVCRR